jgi:ABC-type lipoprotein release transport system permease subunit
LRDRLDPEQCGFSVIAVKDRGLEASRGSTDFGEYFVYFSFFLIAAAVLLSALFFRLGVEQRLREIGTLQAVGFPHGILLRVFLLEGALLSVGGALLGLFGSIGYGWLLVHGLRSWWVGAVGTRRLDLYVSWLDLTLGAAVGILASLATVALTLRGLQQNSTRALLAGILEPPSARRRRARTFGITALAASLAACLVLLGSTSGRMSDVGGYFGAGLLLLVSSLSLVSSFLRRAHPGSVAGHGWPALFRLAVRNTMHRPGRSVICAALIAVATFVIVSVEAFRKDARSLSLEATSGTGGYALLAQSALPIIHDPNSAAGREALGMPDSGLPVLGQAKFVSFRLRPGDDVSCLNLYAPQEPRILGAPHSFLAGARFAFQDSMASTAAEERNPWLLLESGVRDDVIPAIGDANTIRYILHLEVGSELTLRRNHGVPVRLRLVAALRDSLFQGELLISEANFLRLFPEQEGFRFFLLDVPPDRQASLARALEDHLADWGFSVESSLERLDSYHRVENTYLSTFQALGTLGLVLGTVGLATILLRNVLERRKELALLRAVGYRRRVLSGIIVGENLVLLVAGSLCGACCALVAILPALHTRGVPFPAAKVGLMLLSVVLFGLTSSVLAVLAALRSPLLDALRSE